MPPQATIKVAAAQLPGLPLDRAAESLDRIEKAVADAASRKADLLILPECAYPAYWLDSIAAYRAARRLSSGEFVARLTQLAKRHGINLVCGLVEEAGDHLYNSAVVIDAAGNECGWARKSFLWGNDNVVFQPGDSIGPIDTPVGRIGVVICADGRAPEIAMGLVAQGAQLIAIPTCWVNVAAEQGKYANAQAEFMARGRALETQVPIAAANKFGQETATLGYCGWSQILDGKGKLLAKAPPDEEVLIDAEVTLVTPQPVEVPDWSRRRIFSGLPPVLPDAEELETVRIAVVPGRVMTPPRRSADNDLLTDLAEQGVQILATWIPNEDKAEQLILHGRAMGMVVVDHSFVERLMMESFGSFGCVASEHISLFAAARLMALDGAAIVFVAGEAVDTDLLRTRAVENRVYVAGAFSNSAVLIDPAGQVIAACEADSPRPLIKDIDLRASAHKVVFERTHIWEQRRPAVYARAFGITERFLDR